MKYKPNQTELIILNHIRDNEMQSFGGFGIVNYCKLEKMNKLQKPEVKEILCKLDKLKCVIFKHEKFVRPENLQREFRVVYKVIESEIDYNFNDVK